MRGHDQDLRAKSRKESQANPRNAGDKESLRPEVGSQNDGLKGQTRHFDKIVEGVAPSFPPLPAARVASFAPCSLKSTSSARVTSHN